MPKPLSEIVIEEGLATAEQVERAAEWCDRERAPMVVALVHELGIDELALVAAIRRHVRVAMGDPLTTVPELDAVRELPREVARRLRVAPLAITSHGGARRGIEVAIADPTDAVALAEVEHVTGCVAVPRLMPLGAVEELVERTYRHLVTEVMRRGEARPPRRRAAGGAGRRAQGRGRAHGITDEVSAAAVPGEKSARTEAPLPLASVDSDLHMRHRALLTLLVNKGLIALDEYEAEVRRLAEGREREG